MAEQGGLAAEPAKPPLMVRRRRLAWHHTLKVTDSLERMLRDERFPLVRRLVHGLSFCDHLEDCQLHRMSAKTFSEVIEMLETSAIQETSALFRSRRPPGRATGMLFRQTALEYCRLHPKFVIESSWGERIRLVRAAMRFARGRGQLPDMHACFPSTTFEALEQPRGPLPETVLQPLTSFFEANAVSKYYAMMARPGWSIVESYRALALAHPLALWMLRWVGDDRTPQPEDMIDIVRAIDRAQSYPLLAGHRHRNRVKSLARRHELARLLAWYAG
jgi:hypothetical protein